MRSASLCTALRFASSGSMRCQETARTAPHTAAQPRSAPASYVDHVRCVRVYLSRCVAVTAVVFLLRFRRSRFLVVFLAVMFCLVPLRSITPVSSVITDLRRSFRARPEDMSARARAEEGGPTNATRNRPALFLAAGVASQATHSVLDPGAEAGCAECSHRFPLPLCDHASVHATGRSSNGKPMHRPVGQLRLLRCAWRVLLRVLRRL